MKAFKIVLWLVVLALVVWGIFALVNKGEVSEEGPIKIGLVGPFTGDAAAYGEPLLAVSTIAASEINENGGINGRELQIVQEDGACNGKDAANAVQKLINVDQVKYVIGGFCSGESLAMVPIADEAGVLLLSPSSSSPDLTGISKFFVRNYPSDATQGKVLAELSYNEKGWKKVAAIQEQTDYAQGFFESFNSAFESLGGETVREIFTTGDSDFRTSLTKLKNENPDALLISVQAPAAGEKVVRQLSDLGWEIPIMVIDSVAGDQETVERNAEFLEGALAAVFGFNLENPKMKALIEAYEKEYGGDLPHKSYSQTGYDAVHMLADAIREVGDNPESVAEWLRNVKNWDGASGQVDIGDNGDRVGGHSLRVIRNGEVVDYASDDSMMTDEGGEMEMEKER